MSCHVTTYESRAVGPRQCKKISYHAIFLQQLICYNLHVVTRQCLKNWQKLGMVHQDLLLDHVTIMGYQY